jgi:hypothetical protein
MKINELKWDGTIENRYSWVPRLITLGSNIRGRRFQRGSAYITPEELEHFLTPDHSESMKRLQEWLRDLEYCYYKDGEQ